MIRLDLKCSCSHDGYWDGDGAFHKYPKRQCHFGDCSLLVYRQELCKNHYSEALDRLVIMGVILKHNKICKDLRQIILKLCWGPSWYLCSQPGCSVKIKNNSYCKNHFKCLMDDCPNLRKKGKNYCRIHK